jgi:hypothetical protein
VIAGTAHEPSETLLELDHRLREGEVHESSGCRPPRARVWRRPRRSLRRRRM